MDKKFPQSKRSLKRTGSDSGISNDSMDSQAKLVTATQGAKRVCKPFTFKITVTEDKTRIVNGKELIVPQASPCVTENEDLSVDSDQDMTNNHEDYDYLDDVSDHSLDSILNTPCFSPNPESVASFDDTVDDFCSYWERDEIDICVITSMNKCFEGAVLHKEYITKMYLPGYSPIQKMPDIPYVPKPLDDDLISLHPNESFGLDSNKNLKVTPLKKKVRLSNHLQLLPTQNSHENQVNTQKPISTRINTNTNSTVNKSAAISKVIPTAETNHDKVAMKTCNETKENNLQLSRLPDTSQHFTQPVEIPQNIPSLLDITFKAPSLKERKLKLLNLPLRICRDFERCGNMNSCTFIHQLNSNMFHGSYAAQQQLWKIMKGKFYPGKLNVIKAVLEQFPAALASAGNRDVLMILIQDALTFEGLVFEREKIVKEIINALLQVKVGDEYLNYETVIDEILKYNNCFQKEQGRQAKTLCDIILSITVERENFLQYWPLLEKMFGFFEGKLDFEVVNKIISACMNDDVSYELVDNVYKKLLKTDLVDQEQLPASLLLMFVETMRVKAEEKIAKAESPVRQVNINEMMLRELFTQCTNAEELSNFLHDHCRDEDFQAMSIRTVDDILKKELSMKNNINVHMMFFKDSVCNSMLGAVSVELRRLLMVLALHLVTFMRQHQYNNDFSYGISADLLGLFEEHFEELHSTQVYFPDYEDNCLRSVLIFSRLIHGKNFPLALRWIKTKGFVIPSEDMKLAFSWFFTNLRQLFNGMYASGNFDECKNLIILLMNHGFDVEGQKVKHNWSMFDYYRTFIKQKILPWRNNERDLIADAHESIFKFYKHIELSDLRNILVLLYLKENWSLLPKSAEILHFCQDFYKQNEETIFYNAHLSITEIQLVTHIFFYKMLRRNQCAMPVTAEYGELPNGDVPNVPFVKTSGVWDTERSLAKRVNYALIKFTPGSISKFNGTFQVDYVKHLLEQIRRRVHPL